MKLVKMNNKQLIKVIKALVEVESAKQQEHFLSKTFPKILAEEVRKKLLEVKGGVVSVPSPQVVEDVVDPFQQAELALQEQRQAPKKQLSRNPILNEVLNNTTPFSQKQRAGAGQGGNTSVLDGLPKGEVIQENTHVPSYMDAEPNIDQTVNMGTSLGAGGTDALRAQMAHKMGYGNIPSQSGRKSGLGVSTGLPGLDKILNRDNSELVKKFKR